MSRITAEINGITMIARIRPAVNMPMPMGGPTKRFPTTGQVPRWSLTQGWMFSESSGASTNSPHMP
jgi:hypothetical protein